MEVGDRVEVKLSKDWVTVLKIDEFEDCLCVSCRLKDYRIIELFDFEIHELK